MRKTDRNHSANQPTIQTSKATLQLIKLHCEVAFLVFIHFVLPWETRSFCRHVALAAQLVFLCIPVPVLANTFYMNSTLNSVRCFVYYLKDFIRKHEFPILFSKSIICQTHGLESDVMTKVVCGMGLKEDGWSCIERTVALLVTKDRMSKR